MPNSAQWSKLVAVTLVLLFGAVPSAADSPDLALEETALEVQATVELVPIHEELAADMLPIFDSVLDKLRQNSCGCRDQCFSDLQCVWQNGPGSTCEPVGPCGCKECTATF